MTMADTIAVMNAGKVEQLGAPIDLYENPVTTFVANFLGQSNLLKGTLSGKSGGDVAARRPWRADGDADRAHPLPVRRRLGRCAAREGARSAPPARLADGENSLTGVVTDASYMGVSTQYLVRLPWDQEVSVFAQNLSTAGPMSVGDPAVLHWEPAHTFALDAAQDVDAGAERIEGDE